MEESLEQTFDKYMKGSIESKEKKLKATVESGIPKFRAAIIKRYFDELVKAGFKKEDALAIICSGIIQA